MTSANLVSGQGSFDNNWAKGHYGEGVHLAESVVDAVRREVENTDCLQGIQLVQSLGGGTGSGLGSLLQSKLNEEYCTKTMKTYAVMPSWRESEAETNVYNTMLSIGPHIENGQLSVLFDNEALHGICKEQLQIEEPTYADLNRVMAADMAGVTSNMRFAGPDATDLRQMTVNLVPYPRIHFCLSGVAPLRRDPSSLEALSVP